MVLSARPRSAAVPMAIAGAVGVLFTMCVVLLIQFANARKDVGEARGELACQEQVSADVNIALEGFLIVLERVDRLGWSDDLLGQALVGVANSDRDAIVFGARRRGELSAEPRAAELQAETARLLASVDDVKDRARRVVDLCSAPNLPPPDQETPR